MSIQEQLIFHRNAQEPIVVSTPKFEGFKYLNVKNNIESQNNDNDLKKSLDINNSIIEERIILSERKKDKKPSYINFKLNNSTDKKKYYTSIFYNYKKINKNKQDSEKQISFDEKSENYLFTNKSKNNNKTDINDNKCFEDIKEENNLSSDKKENEDFNYDLPLEMDKSSDFFNFTINQQNQMASQKEKEKDNSCRVSKFQEFNYNNLLINSINNEKNANKISINFRKQNNNNDDDNDNENNNINHDNKNYLDDKSKKYFSFDGGNQTNDEIIVDKDKENNEDIKDDKEKEKDNDNKEKKENRKILDKNKDIKENDDINENKSEIIKDDNINDKKIEKKINIDRNLQTNEFATNQTSNKNLNSFKKKFLLTDILSNEIIFKQYCNTEEKENPCNINNNDDENKINNIIYTPKKEYVRKFNSNMQSKITKIPKGYSIQNNKKLINKNLIGYLAFNNSNSLKSKNSHIYEDSFSYKKSLENSKIYDFNPTKKLIFEGINDSIENSGKKKKVIANYKEISKCNKLNKSKMHYNYSYEISDNYPKESIYLQFNNHLKKNGHFDNDFNNHNKKYYPKNERFYKYITKNKKKSLSNKHSIVLYDKDKRYSSIDFNNFIKISKSKDKLNYKYSPGRENSKTSMNAFYNSISIGNNYLKNKQRFKENSNFLDEKDLCHSLNFADDKSNKFINKRNNTLKSIPVQKRVNLIKVNKIFNNKNIKNSENSKKKINKFEANANSTFTNRLTYTNSSKMLKIKNSVLNTTNSEFNTNNKIAKQNFKHKTTKINHTNNLKMKIESFKKINSNSRNCSYENFNNFISNKSSKEVLNKKVITKTKSNFDEKKVILVNKDSIFYKNFNSRNYYVDQTFNTKYYTNQNKCNSLLSSQILKSSENDFPIFHKNKIKVNDNKTKPYFNKIKNVVFNKEKVKKYKNSNILKNSNYKKDYVKNNIIKKNQINKKKIPKNKIYNFDSLDIKSSINMNNNDIIKYSIMRNNQNNQVSHAISVTLGNNDKNKSNENNKKNYKKTIINVNQYYPSYYINTNNLNKIDEGQNKNNNNSNNLFHSENSFKTIIIKNKK